MGIYEVSNAVSDQHIKWIGEIDSFNGSWDALNESLDLRLSSLKKVSTVASIGSSTRIEGAEMSDEEVDLFLNNIEGHSFLSRDQQEVRGYKDLLETIFDSYSNIDINENFIKQLHKILLTYSDKDTFHLGNYKTLDNHVHAKQGDQVIGIVFKTSTPFNTPQDMYDLIDWYKGATEVHSLIKIAVFVVHFLAIHPFQDGNGRLSRALTTLLLLQSGYSYVQYVSLESIIEVNKKEYYFSLRKTQQSFSNTPNYTPWFNFFFHTLIKQKDILSELINKRSNPRLAKTQQSIISFAQEVDTFTNSDVVSRLGINKNTVKINLTKLVNLNMLERHGKGKGTYYRLNRVIPYYK